MELLVTVTDTWPAPSLPAEGHLAVSPKCHLSAQQLNRSARGSIAWPTGLAPLRAQSAHDPNKASKPTRIQPSLEFEQHSNSTSQHIAAPPNAHLIALLPALGQGLLTAQPRISHKPQVYPQCLGLGKPPNLPATFCLAHILDMPSSCQVRTALEFGHHSNSNRVSTTQGQALLPLEPQSIKGLTNHPHQKEPTSSLVGSANRHQFVSEIATELCSFPN